MDLSQRGREYYKLAITTVPATSPVQWEASFDNGATWVPAIDSGGLSAWLVRGPLAATGSEVAVITTTMQPQVRLTVAPEIVVRNAPTIRLTR